MSRITTNDKNYIYGLIPIWLHHLLNRIIMKAFRGCSRGSLQVVVCLDRSFVVGGGGDNGEGWEVFAQRKLMILNI